MNKVLLEMEEILGGKTAEMPKIDPTQPREVVGTFVVQGVTAVDEVILESIAELDWEQVADIAALATIGPSDFQDLALSFAEGIGSFRQTWNTLANSSALAEGLNRGSFVYLSKVCPQNESFARYVYWCLNALQEASEDTLLELAEKSPAVQMVIPTGQTKKQWDRDTDNAKPFQGKELIEPYEKSTPERREFMSKKMKEIDAERDAAVKMAKGSGKSPDEAFINLFVDLDREAARNS
jgi:hypothetical protein